MNEPKKSSAPRRRGLFVVMGVIALVAVAAVVVVFRPSVLGSLVGDVVENQLTYKVTRGNLRISFNERGTVNALKSVPIFCQLEGSSTIVSLVAEGTFVKAGDILVELDASKLEQDLNQQEIAVESARSSWLQAIETQKIQESLNSSNLEQAELDVELAEIDLQRYLEGEYEQAKKKAENDITIAEEELARARDKSLWTKKLADKGYVTRMDEQADQLAVKRAEVTHEQAVISKTVLEKYTHRKDEKTYRSALSQAKAALDRARSKANSELAKVTADVKEKESTMKLSERRLTKIQDQLAKTKILAPQDGMVVFEAPDFRRGRERAVEQGAEVGENQTLMQLPDVSVMSVAVQVHESWIDKVAEGLPAFISIDALPTLRLRGRVTRVGLLPDKSNQWRNPDLKVYRTEITIESGEDTSVLKPGMSSNVEIVVTDLRDIVFVPVQSVTTIDKSQVVYVQVGSSFEPRPVTCGLHNDAFIEVKTGLEPGEVVQLNAPAPQTNDDAERVDEVLASPIVEGAGAPGVPAAVGPEGRVPGYVPGGAGGEGRGLGGEGRGLGGEGRGLGGEGRGLGGEGRGSRRGPRSERDGGAEAVPTSAIGTSGSGVERSGGGLEPGASGRTGFPGGRPDGASRIPGERRRGPRSADGAGGRTGSSGEQSSP
jgi:HlyD family secretion protein